MTKNNRVKMNSRERAEELIEELKQYYKYNIIMVEGKKDVNSLRDAGIESTEITGAIFEFAESIDANEALILTDFDSKGEELRLKIKEALSMRGIEENIRLRKKFRGITRLSHIEGLSTFIKNMGSSE